MQDVAAAGSGEATLSGVTMVVMRRPGIRAVAMTFVRRAAVVIAVAMASVIALATMTIPAAEGGARPPFSSRLAGFEVRVRDDVNPYDVLGVFAMPGETLRLEILRGASPDEFHIVQQEAPAGEAAEGEAPAGEDPARDGRADEGRSLHGRKNAPAAIPAGLRRDSDGSWTWHAPAASGLHPLTIIRKGNGQRMTLNVFVLVPREGVRDGVLNGYRIGSYPSTPLRGLPVYLPPPGFIEVTPDNEDTWISPHFRVGQFLCKQEGGPPRYLVLRERFLLKLEGLLQETNASGIRCDSFFIMSGYRTPSYNAAIGNVRYSRHLYGDAADLFVDENPRDGVMDDLNGDGRIDDDDARVLYDIIERFDSDPGNELLLGGLGRYGTTSTHGPFVHTDVRGFRARW
jgi:hypothetical protein